MLDIENEVFNDLTELLVNAFPTITTSSVYTNTPSKYPFVSIEEISSSVNINEETSCNIDEITNVGFEVNVYSKDPQKKSNAKAMAKVVDEYMIEKGFYRVSKTPMQDDNETIYRFVLRYNGNISLDNKIYRR